MMDGSNSSSGWLEVAMSNYERQWQTVLHCRTSDGACSFLAVTVIVGIHACILPVELYSNPDRKTFAM